MESVFEQGYGLVIGVGNDLPATVNDASAIHEFLIDSEKGRYLYDNIALLTEKDATADGICRAFEELLLKVKDASTSIVFIYYSGHGGVINEGEDNEEYFLVPYDYDPDDHTKSLFSGETLKKYLNGFDKARVLLILDCCHAQGVPKNISEKKESYKNCSIPKPLINSLRKSSGGKIYIGSCRDNELSWTDGMYSVFTRCLLEGLSGNGEQKTIRVLDLLAYLFQEVPTRAPEPQHPVLVKATDLGENFSVCLSEKYKGTTAKKENEFLTHGEIVRMKMNLESLQAQYDLLVEKLSRMRKEIVIQNDIPAKFKLEHQLVEGEQDLSVIFAKITEIEVVLAGL